MKKYVRNFLKVLLSLVMMMPIAGGLGIFPAPTSDLYNTPQAFAFIDALMNAGYINPIMALVFSIALIALWTKREALAALLISPITLNIVAFHLFLDGGLLTPGAVLADILLLLNIYFLHQCREQYRTLFAKRA